MRFESLDLPENANYHVPANLVKLRNEFLQEAIDLSGFRQHARADLLMDKARFETVRWLRNHYLHRSAHTATEGGAYVGMDGNANGRRTIIQDDVLADPSGLYTPVRSSCHVMIHSLRKLDITQRIG